MKVVSLFAGIGGFDLALTRLGHEIVYVNEWDKYAAQTYEKNFQSKPDIKDIKQVDTSDIPSHDLLVAGFPCQSFSIAGLRRGFSDTRGTLFFDIARILSKKHPRYIMLENVKGLLSHDGGRTFKTIINALTELGYDLQWQVLNSKNFGVPQNRERVFIIGNLRGRRRPEIFPLTGEIGQVSEARSVVGTLQSDYFKRDRTGGYVIEEDFIALTEKRSDKAKEIRREMRKQGRDWNPRREKVLVARTDGKVGTITSTRNFDTLLTNGSRIRLLTPVECERLQGFPDKWTEGVSDTQRYKQLGNAVTVNVVSEIAKYLPL